MAELTPESFDIVRDNVAIAIMQYLFTDAIDKKNLKPTVSTYISGLIRFRAMLESIMSTDLNSTNSTSMQMTFKKNFIIPFFNRINPGIISETVDGHAIGMFQYIIESLFVMLRPFVAPPIPPDVQDEQPDSAEMEIVIVHLFATIMKEVIMFETRHPGIRDLYEKGIQFFRNKGEKPRALVDRMNALGLPLEAMAAQESNPLYGFFEEIKAIIFRIFSTEYNSMCSLQSGDIARRSYFGEIFGTQ